MKVYLSALLLISFFGLPEIAAAGELALADLIKPIAIQQVKISPDGDKLAVVTIRDGKRVLALMTLEPLKTTFVLHFEFKQEVGNFYWVNNERVVTTVWERRGWMDSPVRVNYLYAIDYDGRKSKTVFGYQKGDSVGKNSRVNKQKSHTAHADVISTLPKDDKHILITTYPWQIRGNYWRFTGESFGEVLKLNVYNGRTKKLMSVPGRGGRAYADDDGIVHFADGVNGDGIAEFYERKNDEWLRVGDVNKDYYARPVGYSEDGKTAFISVSSSSDRNALISRDLATGMETERYSHPRVSISDVTNYPGTSNPMVVHTEDGKPGAHFLDESHKVTRYLRGIHKAFEGYRVRIESATADGKLGIVAVDGDNIPTDYFLVNFESKAAEMLMSSANWLEPSAMANTEVFEMTARDGLLMQGYLTFPKTGRENLPMVVRPHGGPSSRDYWEYDSESQILANEGFLVLSVNFRGSTGYGESFSVRSDGNWGSLVQNDIADATRWAVEKGYATADKICIYGTSFGAYSALMGVIREPELYQCAAGFAGVYDLEMMYHKGDIPRRRAGVSYLKEVLGTDNQILQKFSPVHSADKVKVPVFIAHGGEDKRAPIEHAYALEQALRDANVSVETQYYEKGGHGYYTQEANMELYTGLLTFLNKHIGEK